MQRAAGSASAGTAPAAAGYSSAARAGVLNAALRAPVFADSASAPAEYLFRGERISAPDALPGTAAAAQACQRAFSGSAHALPDLVAGALPAQEL